MENKEEYFKGIYLIAFGAIFEILVLNFNTTGIPSL